MNKKFSLLIVAIIAAVAIAVITITVTENISTKSSDSDIAPPTPQKWVRCAIENGVCHPLRTTTQIRYGEGENWIVKDTGMEPIGPTDCNNATFGDPAHGQVKACYYPDYVSPPPGPWVRCAMEHGQCGIDEHLIRYGANNEWVYGEFYGTMSCNNTTFGDPAYSFGKACYYQGTEPAGPWVPCATEHGACYQDIIELPVKYGIEDNWVYGTFSNSVECNNTRFGDPAYGHGKACFYQGTTPAGPWLRCATDGGQCSNYLNIPSIRFGVGTHWLYEAPHSDVALCHGAMYGDPAVNHVKECYMEGINVASAWVLCAFEGETCNMPSYTSVKYGAKNNWVYGIFEESFVCDASTFSNISVSGLTNACYYQDTAIPVNAPWVLCASTPNGTCHFYGEEALVRYGNPAYRNADDFVYGYFNNTVSCNSSAFGNPNNHNVDYCYYQDVTPEGPWVKCAGVGGTCTNPLFHGQMTIKYGSSPPNGEWAYGTFDQNVYCSKSTFGSWIVSNNPACYTNDPNYTEK